MPGWLQLPKQLGCQVPCHYPRLAIKIFFLKWSWEVPRGLHSGLLKVKPQNVPIGLGKQLKSVSAGLQHFSAGVPSIINKEVYKQWLPPKATLENPNKKQNQRSPCLCLLHCFRVLQFSLSKQLLDKCSLTLVFWGVLCLSVLVWFLKWSQYVALAGQELTM